MAYPNVAAQDGPSWTALKYGFRVERAVATLPQTATTTYFTVAGGRVACFFLGEMVGASDATACNFNLVHTPTGGTVGDLSAAASIASKEIGCMIGITGLPGDATLITTAGVRFQNPVVLKPGAVGAKASGNNPGTTKWVCWYLPIDEGATVAAA
jgi:hypothetical protein